MREQFEKAIKDYNYKMAKVPPQIRSDGSKVYSEARKRQLILKFEESDLPLNKFAENHGIAISTFNRWINPDRYKKYNQRYKKKARKSGLIATEKPVNPEINIVKNYSEEKKSEAVTKFQKSDLTIPVFCKNEGINQSTFRGWLDKAGVKYHKRKYVTGSKPEKSTPVNKPSVSKPSVSKPSMNPQMGRYNDSVENTIRIQILESENQALKLENSRLKNALNDLIK